MINEVLTINELVIDERTGALVLRFDEIPVVQSVGLDWGRIGWFAENFRPLIKDEHTEEADVSLFKSLLNPTRVGEDA